MVLSKSQLKRYSSLKNKKFREKFDLYLIEGIHCLTEAVLSNSKLEAVLSVPKNEAAAKYRELVPLLQNQSIPIFNVTESDLKKVSDSVHPQGVIGIGIKEKELDWKPGANDLILALDEISDPGNVGTLIRSADWFGFDVILVSQNSVEFTSPKVVRSSMGSIFHVNIYDHIEMESKLIEAKKKGYRIVGSAAESKSSIFQIPFILKTILILGNESDGIRPELTRLCDTVVTVPRIGHAESLNVAMAGTIIMSEIRRQLSHK
jgi:TrmH family RNA methyltransferase